MHSRHQVFRAAIEMIERFEGFRRTAAELDDGRWTIGYGHTKTARKGAQVSEADAEALLIYDLMEIASALNDWIYTPLTQNQFDALVAFAFNIGLEAFRQSSVLRRVNEGDLMKAAFAMELWRKADFEGERIVVDALVRRRAAEKALFLTPPHGFVPSPSSVLRPRLDTDAPGAGPARYAVEICAPLEGARAMAERVDPGPWPPPRPEEDERSATELAADAITARLQAILNEPDLPEEAPEAGSEPLDLSKLELPNEDEEPPVPVEPEPAPPAQHIFALTPPVESMEAESSPGPEPVEVEYSEPSVAEPELFAPRDASLEEFEVQPFAHHVFGPEPDLDGAEMRPIRSIGLVPALLGLGVLGLAIFAAGIFWGFDAKQAGDGGLFSDPVMIGWGLGLVGIGCVATSVYFLLERLGGREAA